VGVVTLTTVGYGDVTPITTEGRIAAMALMLLGIGLFDAITVTITSYLMSRDSHHGPDHSLAGKLERLAVLHSAGVMTDQAAGSKVRRVTPAASAKPLLGPVTCASQVILLRAAPSE
jgi:hypothetical protein